MTIQRRCFHFDEDGLPIDKGCTRGKRCAFVHPEDEEWDFLPPTPHPNPAFRGSRRGRTPPREERSRGAWGRRSPHRRSRSRSWSPRSRGDRRQENVPGPSAPPIKQTAGPSSSSRTGANTPSPASASTSVKLLPPPASAPPTAARSGSLPPPPPPPPPMSGIDMPLAGSARPNLKVVPSNSSSANITSPTSPPTGPKALRGFSFQQLNSPTTPIYMVQSPVTSAPAHQASPPPPPPPHSPPIQPPLPLPDVPAGLHVQKDTPPPEGNVNVNDKVAVWAQRTKTFAKCSRLFDAVNTAEKECEDANSVLQSMFFSSLPESERTRLKEQYEALLAQRDATQKEYQAARLELAAADAWPTGPAPQIEDDMREKQVAITKYVQELSGILREMQKILGDIQQFKPPPAPLVLPNDDDDAQGSAMDEDEDPKGKGKASASTTRKRRRTDDGGRAEAQPSQEEMNLVLGVLADLEDKITTLKNDMTSYDQEAQEQFKNVMENKLDEFNRRSAEQRRAREERRVAEDRRRDETLTTLNDEMGKAGKEVGELAKEIADLITLAGDLEIQLVEEKKENQVARSRLTAIEERMKEYTRIQEENVAVVNTLKAALEAYKATPPTPPLTPRHPSAAYILSVIEERVTDSLRMAMKPFLEDLRQNMEGSMSEKNREVYGVVWEKIGKTMKVMEKIKARIDSGVSGDGVARGANQA